MEERPNLTNQFLIAMPGLADPNFYHTVTLICEHTSEGALGIVINRPLGVSLAEIFDQLSLGEESGAAPAGAAPPGLAEQSVLQGGPVQQERGFVLHNDNRRYDSTLQVSENVSVTTSRDILLAMSRGEGPAHALVALGYAGWSAGQLEQEISDNAWLSVPATEEIIFEVPFAQRWEQAAKLLGVDLSLLSSEAGHA